jgi:hypothetical protein
MRAPGAQSWLPLSEVLPIKIIMESLFDFLSPLEFRPRIFNVGIAHNRFSKLLSPATRRLRRQLRIHSKPIRRRFGVEFFETPVPFALTSVQVKIDFNVIMKHAVQRI